MTRMRPRLSVKSAPSAVFLMRKIFNPTLWLVIGIACMCFCGVFFPSDPRKQPLLDIVAQVVGLAGMGITLVTLVVVFLGWLYKSNRYKG